MRIISGKYRSRKIETLNDLSIRPATDRVKGAIFNSLQSRIDLNGANVLDLFAGSGNIGLEALSRGAQKIVFVENSKYAIEVINKNISSLNENENCDVIEISFEQFLKINSIEFDLVFADPPYVYSDLNKLPKMIFFSKIVKQNGLLVIEHPITTKFETDEIFECIRSANYGRTVVSIFQRKEN